MKTNSTRLALFLLVLLSGLFSNRLSAQMLEEIPNPPPDYSLSWFNGGEGESLFFSYFDNNFITSIFHYDGTDLSPLPIPPEEINFAFYSHSYLDKDYLVVFDINFNSSLYEYDGTNAAPLELPVGYTFGNYITTYDDVMYFTLFDNNFQNFLFRYDGEVIEEVPTPDGLNFNNFVVEYEDLLWLTFTDPSTFQPNLYAFDGINFSEIDGLPSEINGLFLAYEGENDLYLAISDANFTFNLYQYNGTDFTLIPTPENLFFSFIPGENIDAGEVYISYFDNITFANQLYRYTGTELIEIPLPENFDFPNIVSIFNGSTYMSLFDNINFDGALFKLEAGVLGQVAIENNYDYNFHADTLLGNDYHIVYDQNFTSYLYRLDEANNSLVSVEGPAGVTFNNYVATTNDRMFLNYVNTDFFGTLYMYDGTDFTEIPNPAGKFFSFLMTLQDGKLYLRYDNLNDFLGTLYVLTPNSLPTSLDNAVTTDINIPYFFQPEDFSFADADAADSLSAIMVTEIEQVGYLLYDGAHVYEGDIIPVDDIENLIFTPLQDEEGNPYDAFRFRVGDGEAFSEEDYLMQINVQDPATSIQENNLNAMVNISPVPSSDHLNIVLSSNENLANLRLYVFSASGHMILQEVYRSIGNSFTETISLGDWAEGTYYLVGRTDSGNFTKPFIIQR